jgi:hypothetical protein
MIARERSLIWMIGLLFLVGGVLGGGQTSPNFSMFVELIAAFLGAIAIAGLVDGHYPARARGALVLLVLICLVPVLQLIPLPSGYWAALPGRELPGEVLRLADLSGIAAPISLVSEQTRLSGLALVVPAAIFIAVLQIGAEDRDRFMLLIVAFAFISAILGIFQVAAGSGVNLGIYRQVHDGYPIGFFANRNHEGDLLLIALPTSAQAISVSPWNHRAKRSAMIVAALFFSLAVISTQSRTAASLLPIALGGMLAIWIGDVRDRRVWAGLGALLVAGIAGYAILRLTPVGQHLAHRFTTVGDDLRPIVWQGSWAAIKSFWPVGSGVGSFVPVYQMFEDLDSVTDAWVNHAHNDYLEILLETGVVGAILLVAYAVTAGLALIGDAPRPLRRQRYTAVTIILILLVHSVTDYPLRTFALASAFAFANGMLFLPQQRFRLRRKGPHPVSPPPAFVMDEVAGARF